MSFRKEHSTPLAKGRRSSEGTSPVWARVRGLYKGGGTIDAFAVLPPGTVIGAGTMVKFNGSGQEVEISPPTV